MKFRIIEVGPREYQVDYRSWFFWHRLREWKDVGLSGRYINVHFDTIMGAQEASRKLCAKQQYPRIVQQLTLECP